MKIGYPCINNSVGCTPNSTFRLKSYSKENLIEKVTNNLNCLNQILEWNKKQKLLFFRISSDLVPFASHPVCKFNWQKHFKKQFQKTGNFIKKNKFRISMHPDQFVVLNSPTQRIVKNSINELKYHSDVLDLMQLNSTHKIQIHVGGVYGDKESAVQRFIKTYKKLPNKIKKHLVIENDERLYSLKDCLEISRKIKIPVLFDAFHHQCFNHGESNQKAMKSAQKTWKNKDGKLMVDYSHQKRGARKGTHSQHLHPKEFQKFIKQTKNLNYDLMLEIKDKEKSALKALKIIKEV